MSKAGLVLLGILLVTSLILFFRVCGGRSFYCKFKNKVSAAEEIDTSILLLNSAEIKIMSVRQDIGSGTYTTAKINLKASKIDFEEALKILNNTTSGYEEENQDIEKYKTLAEGSLNRVHSMESLLIAMEHSDKSLAYTYSKI